jgi:DNA-directed RNA polymerase subunit RPC12/RpoP
MQKRKYQPEDDTNDGYAEAECPECGAIVTARFQRGRNWRRLQCPVCRSKVTVSIKEEKTPLIQLRRAGAE